jgi:flagellar assembly protein FliH
MNMSNDTIQIKRFDFFALKDFNRNATPTKDVFEEQILGEIAIEEPEIALAPPPPPTFTESELEQAKQIAYQSGYDAGATTAVTQHQHLEAQNQMRFNQQLQNLNAEIANANNVIAAEIATQQQTLAQLAFAVAKKLANDAIEQNSLPLLRGMIAKCLPHIIDFPTLKIIINPDDAKDFWNDITAQITDAAYQGELQIVSEDTMQRGDIKIEWQFGNAERSMEGLIAEIDAISPALPTAIARPQVATITKIK